MSKSDQRLSTKDFIQRNRNLRGVFVLLLVFTFLSVTMYLRYTTNVQQPLTETDNIGEIEKNLELLVKKYRHIILDKRNKLNELSFGKNEAMFDEDSKFNAKNFLIALFQKDTKDLKEDDEKARYHEKRNEQFTTDNPQKLTEKLKQDSTASNVKAGSDKLSTPKQVEAISTQMTPSKTVSVNKFTTPGEMKNVSKLTQKNKVLPILETIATIKPYTPPACQIPKLNPFHQDVMKFVERIEEKKCSGFKYGSLSNGKLRLKASQVQFAVIFFIRRKDDFNNGYSHITHLIKLKRSNFIESKCICLFILVLSKLVDHHVCVDP